MKLICVGLLLHIKFGLEGLHVASVVMSIAARRPCVGVEVIEEAEERGEGWVRAHKCAREERHLACNCWFDNSQSGFDW